MRPPVPVRLFLVGWLTAHATGLWPSPAAQAKGQARSTEDQEPLGQLSEVLLPPYQLSALIKDLPANDLLFAGDQTLMVLGNTALWQWHIATRALQRLVLEPVQSGQANAPLRYLGGDGLNLLAATDQTLFQIQWQQNQVLRYPLAPGTSVRGFAGQADDYWLLHSTGLLQFDRYGKTLIPRLKTPYLANADALAYDAAQRILWAVRGADLLRVDLKRKKPKPLIVFSAEHPLRGLALPEGLNGDVITHTEHAVLRFGADGKARPSVPVEGTRRLLDTAFSRTHHAYLFSDQLLEVFDLARRQAVRYRLPVEDGDEISTLRLTQNYVALLVDGRPRLFHLDTDGRKR